MVPEETETHQMGNCSNHCWLSLMVLWRRPGALAVSSLRLLEDSGLLSRETVACQFVGPQRYVGVG